VGQALYHATIKQIIDVILIKSRTACKFSTSKLTHHTVEGKYRDDSKYHELYAI
jgi:hypothetical protein